MRISDWSSDVCSSDLIFPRAVDGVGEKEPALVPEGGLARARGKRHALRGGQVPGVELLAEIAELVAAEDDDAIFRRDRGAAPVLARPAGIVAHQEQGLAMLERSEEHTSELQSLMRISYAVSCLKKKKSRT